MNYDEGQGWHDPASFLRPAFPGPRHVPALRPEVFEGMKAYKTADGRVLPSARTATWRAEQIFQRALCIPAIDEAFAVKAN